MLRTTSQRWSHHAARTVEVLLGHGHQVSNFMAYYIHEMFAELDLTSVNEVKAALSDG